MISKFSKAFLLHFPLFFLIFAWVSPTNAGPTLVPYKNISSGYVVAFSETIYPIGGSWKGPPVSLFPGQTAYPSSYRGGTRTFYIAYGPSKNLSPNWYTVVAPNMKVTVPDAKSFTIEVKGFKQVYVNGVRASSMY